MAQTAGNPYRSLVIGAAVVAAAAMSVGASFNYMLQPMLDDLGISSSDATVALAIPSIAAIVVVFLAGSLGDRLGPRRVLLAATAMFVAGCALVAVTNGLVLLSLGLLLEGMAATVMGVVALGIIGQRIDDDGYRASAFATFGLVNPIVYLSLPVITGVIVVDHSWRLVPLIWIVIGLLSGVAALRLLPKESRSEGSGELITPLLAGLTLAAAVQAISHISDSGLISVRVLFTAGFGVASAVTLVIVYRRVPKPTLSLAPLRNGALSLLLIVVLLVPFANTWYFITLVYQDVFALTSLQTALVMIPAQVAGIVGAKAIAGPLMRRIGVHKAGTWFLAVFAISMLSLLIVQADSPLWVPMLCMMLFGGASIGAAVVVTNAIMSTSPHSESGNTSAFKGAAAALGVSLGFVIVGGIVFGTAQAALTQRFENSGMSAEQASQEIATLQNASQDPDSISVYSMPLPNGAPTNVAVRESMIDGLHVDGLVGAILGIGATALFIVHRSRLPEAVPRR